LDLNKPFVRVVNALNAAETVATMAMMTMKTIILSIFFSPLPF